MAGTNGKPQREEIERRAYEIWIERGGGQFGGEIEFWLEAERQLTGEGEEDAMDAMNEKGRAPAVPEKNVRTDDAKGDKSGCAKSFIMEERGELDNLCETKEEDPKQEYVQPRKEKEAGGEGG